MVPHSSPHLDNPYAGARPRVNPERSAHADAEPGGAGHPTGVWLDRIAAVAGLRTHLDRAVRQGANPVRLVLRNLPGRDRGRLAAPRPNVDAYAWMKPLGESDGASTPSPAGDRDRMCGPDHTGRPDASPDHTGRPDASPEPSGAWRDAAPAGQWHPAQSQELLRNAHPPR
ncbi:hypothetical protein ACIGNX_26845 [Actinosynnema sp. NPDC053489]|uniref:hypothetical protein n=1 Tax=Actinosynnema sp. NPDC053489 TaxID=3363916 RepID=UPI0037C734A5